MASFLGKLRSGNDAKSPTTSSPSKKDPHAPQPTPLERMLENAGPIRNDGSDKFFGMENFGNTCYCNSILQCLYYTPPFRENVLAYPQRSTSESLAAAAATAVPRPQYRLQNGVLIRPGQPAPAKNVITPSQQPGQKPEDKESPEYKKKLALAAGPIINMTYQNAAGYEMPENMFTSLKDIFEAVVAEKNRHGIVSPARFLEVLRRENEMFRSAMHQDAHEFLNLLLNSVIDGIEDHEKKQEARKEKNEITNSENTNGHVQKSVNTAVSWPPTLPVADTNSRTKWLREMFEGTSTSETRCLTCENVSQRDEPFLDLSVDLDQHSSVTACLNRYSEEEMLCERNKFHCDNCGGLQEAEKRMKIKRLPQILALHLKRFKYTEDLARLQKLHHKVVYPYHLRLFNTTDDAEDPDRLYELYAVVVHIGGGPYHGHYVSIIKTQDRGWLLFDDEMVEPVSRSYVQNFFGDKAGLATAYVLFYRKTTEEEVERDQRMEGRRRASQDVNHNASVKVKDSVEIHRTFSSQHPLSPLDTGPFVNIDSATVTSQVAPNGHLENPRSPLMAMMSPTSPNTQSRKEKAKEEKERKAAEKAMEKEKEKADKYRKKELDQKLKDAQKKQQDDSKAGFDANKPSKADEDRRYGNGEATDKENTTSTSNNLTSRDLFRRSKSFKFGSLGRKDKPSLTSGSAVDESPSGPGPAVVTGNGAAEEDQVATKEKEKKNRFSIRKKSFNML